MAFGRRLFHLSRHLTPRFVPSAVAFSTAASPPAAASSVALTGHYARLTGICEEQARLAFDKKAPDKSKDGWSIATFAGGCFWGPQLFFDRIEGVVATSVGYTQGDLEKPTYEAICTGRTRHTEAVQVFFDESVVSYQDLLKEFWSSIDPTVVDGQGNDLGSQYRTGIYCHNGEQARDAMISMTEEQRKYKKVIATEVTRAAVYWPAEPEHQNYLVNGGRMGRGQSNAKGCKDPIRCYG